MLSCPCKLVWPVVVAVGGIALLVAGHTLLFASDFSSFYDAYIAGNDAVPVPAFVFFRRFYGIGPVLALVILGSGAWLDARAQVQAVHVAWYASLSGVATFAWFAFTLVVERVLISQYGLPV